MSKKNFINSIVIGVLVTVISTFIGTAIIAIYNQINIIQAIMQVFQWIRSFLIYKFPLYGFFLIIIGIIFVKKIIKKTERSSNIEWLNYKKDLYQKWVFVWDYYLDSNHQYAMKDLRPICKCGCELSIKTKIGNTIYSDEVLACPNCKFIYPKLDEEIVEDFKKIVYYNIKNSKYPITNDDEPYQ